MTISNILKNLSAAANRATLIVLGLAGTAQAITLQTTDFISNADRTNFNGFEGLPDTLSYEFIYIEDGIRVFQGHGQLNDIWTSYQDWGAEGLRSWYPNGGDYGFTIITRPGHSNFNNIGLLIGSGFGSNSPVTYVYQVLKNELSSPPDGPVPLLSGTLFRENSPNYIGFSGGGFNEIRLAAYYGNNPQQILGAFQGVSIGGFQALAIDSIELSNSSQSVPEPRTLMGLLGLGFLGTGSAIKLKLQSKHK